MTTSLVSVVLPVYNGERYLREAIESVLRQSLSDFTLYICDDASNDHSREIIRSFQDERIIFLTNETNAGLFPTLNKLVQCASSPLVKLWAQDDLMMPTCLEEMVALHRRLPSLAMSYCAYDEIDTEGNLIKLTKWDNTPEEISPSLATQIMFYYGSITGNISNVLLNTVVLEKIGYFREDMKVSGDFEMWVRICEQHYIGRVKKALIFLRSHEGQFSRQNTSILEFAYENESIRETLASRLDPKEKGFAIRYEKRNHYVNLCHLALRCVLKRDFYKATQLFSIISTRHSVPEILFWWLATVNGRYWALRPALETPID